MSTATDFPELRAWQRTALLVGVIALGVALLGLLLPDLRIHFFRAWLVAFCLVVGLALGSLVIVMLQYLTGGDWGYLLRRPLEAATRTMPLVTLFYLPLALGLPYLYLWAQPDVVTATPALQHKSLYLNPTFAWIRAGIYFAIWNLLAYLLNSWSRQQDSRKDPALHSWCETLSAPGLVLYVLSITFASIDWVMSLEPEWYSTIYGAMFGMGQVLSALAFGIVVLTFLGDRPPLQQALAGQTMRDLGSLLLAFVMVWAYLSFSQFLLIWSGNLPEEVPWYIYRLSGPWKYAGLALVLFHFALPFVLLLSTDIKRNRRLLGGVALLVLFMRIIDLLWLIIPAFDHGKAKPPMPLLGAVIYLAVLVAVAGLWLGYLLRELAKLPLLPEYKPSGEGMAHGAIAQH